MDPVPVLEALLKGERVLAALLVLSLLAIMALFRKITTMQATVDKCQTDRIEDLKTVVDQAVKAIAQSSAHTSVSAVALENMNTTNASRVVTLERLVDRTENMTRVVDELRDEVIRCSRK